MTAEHLQFNWLSDSAVLVQPVPGGVLPSGSLLEAAFPDLQVRHGLDSVLFTASSPTSNLLERVRETLRGWENVGALMGEPGARTVVIPVRYNGEDLEAVAGILGVSSEEVVRRHLNTTWTVRMLGFAPGFPYLSPQDSDPTFSIPRRDTPRSQVPAGSVGLAAGLSCIYPSAMPGGWWLIGSTEMVLFNPNADSPSLLGPGDVIRFEAQR